MPTDAKRTKMIHLYTPDGGDYRIEVERETRRTYENGDKVSLPNGDRIVQRMLSAIGADALPGGPYVVTTYEDLRVVIAACADALAEEDEAAAAARAAALAAERAALNPDVP